MAILEQNWIMLAVVTVVSLLVCWIGGCRKQSLLWIVSGAIAAIVLSVVAVNLNWIELGTATLAYGVMVIYCPLMWIIIQHTHSQVDNVHH